MRETARETIQGQLWPAVVEMMLGEDELDVSAFAQQAGYSVRHFHRLFHQLHGETVMAMARRLRMERAASRLRAGDEAVGDLALAAGFQSPEAFTRAFRERFGIPPSHFRQSATTYPLLASPNGVHWTAQPVPRPLASRGEHMITPKLVPFASRPFYYKLHVGVAPDIAATWAQVNSELGSLGIDRTNARFFTRCLSGPEESPESQRFQCGVCTSVPFELPSGFETSELGGGQYAVFVHQGPDDLIVDTWDRAFSEWLPVSGREFGGECFEEYVNGFYLKPEQEDERLIVTAVYMKLA